MIAKKKKMGIIIITLIIILVVGIIATLVALYFTTDIFKASDILFTKYILQNVDMANEVATQEATGIKDFLATQKLETNLTAKLSYSDKEGKNISVNNAEIDISSKIDKQEQYNYKDIRLAYENEKIAQMEYMQSGETYGIRLEGIKQFVTATKQNLDELELKTGISKKDLEYLTYMFEPLNVSQFISFTPSEVEVLSSTYLSILQQHSEKSQYKKSKEVIDLNGAQYSTNAYSLKLTEEELNNLIIAILEQIEKDQILLGKLDVMEEQLTKYYLYEQKDGQTLRNTVIQLIDDEIQEIKNHNIGQEETEITVYVYDGQTVRTMLKTSKETINLDMLQGNIKIEYIENLDNSVIKDNIIIERAVQTDSQTMNFQYQKMKDDVEEQNFKIEINQNKENEEMQNTYKVQYAIGENVANLDITQYINQVEQFEEKPAFDENNSVNLENLEQDQAQRIIKVLDANVNEKIKNIISHITLEDINLMLKNLQILNEHEITFNEDSEEETVTEVERNRFNSQLSMFIGKNVNTDTVKQLIETVKGSMSDAQITYEPIKDSDKTRVASILVNVKRNTSNEEKFQELLVALAQEGNSSEYTVTMAFDENTRLINQITIVANVKN